MKLRGGGDGSAVALPPGVIAVLVYGPDEGMVREQAAAIASAVAPADDPFRTVTITAGQLRDQPSLVADEAAAIAFGGGRRVVRVRDAGDVAVPAFAALFDGVAGNSLVVVEAGDLNPRSRLRRMFEDARNAAALACYRDDAAAVGRLIDSVLGQYGQSADDDARLYLIANLGSDRMVSRSELEKLALYRGEPGVVTLQDAQDCVEGADALALDDLLDEVGLGRTAEAARALQRLYDAGIDPIGVVRAGIRHFDRLHRCRAVIDRGASVDQAVRGLSPPLFFRRAEGFRNQLRRWPAPALRAALAALTEAEIQCKTTGLPAAAICERLVLSLAVRASGSRAA